AWVAGSFPCPRGIWRRSPRSEYTRDKRLANRGSGGDNRRSRESATGQRTWISRAVDMPAALNLLVGLIAVLLFGLSMASPCFAVGAAPDRSSGGELDRADAHTLGNPGQVRVTHL